MMEKAYRASFWKKISLKKYKATRLSDVHYICNFMKRVRGQREVPKKILSAEEQAVRDQQAAVSRSSRVICYSVMMMCLRGGEGRGEGRTGHYHKCVCGKKRMLWSRMSMRGDAVRVDSRQGAFSRS